MVLEAVAVLQKQEAVLVDRSGVDGARGWRFAGRERDIERIVEQDRRIDLAAVERQRQQHTIKLPPKQNNTRSTTKHNPKIELQVRPLAAQARQHRRKEERRD